jgi:hypothetical protein
MTSSSCAVDRDEWSCVLPAGLHDVRLRAPGHVSIYLPGTTIRAGQVTNAGTVALRRGASVIGRVDVESPSRDRRARPSVTLQPYVAYAAPTSLERHRSLSRERIVADDRGFFHFDGVTAGSYIVTAELPGHASATSMVDVVEGRESELAEPLLLQPPKTLEVSLMPPLDPDGKPWHVSFSKRTAERTLQRVSESAASSAGLWNWRGAPGNYALEISTSAGVLWKYVAEVIVDSSVTRVHLPVAAELIRGRVRLGDRPLKATLHFGATNGPAAESDDEGNYSVAVPPNEQDAWRVTVTNDKLGMNRHFDVERSGEDGTVDIDIPAGRIAGTIFDERGDVPDVAIVTVRRSPDDGEFVQTRTRAGGVFEIAGLVPGHYVLWVDAGERQSDDVAVSIDGAGERRLEVAVRPRQRLRGRVLSAEGPIAGAEIWVIPLQPVALIPGSMSREDGRFSASVSHGTREFDMVVSARGFAHHMLRAPYRSDAAMQVRLSQIGGTLTVEIPRSALRPPGAYLVRGLARMPVVTFERWSIARKTRDRDHLRLEIPSMEPGAYTLCLVTPGAVPHTEPLDAQRCASGTLAPYGSLALAVK